MGELGAEGESVFLFKEHRIEYYESLRIFIVIQLFSSGEKREDKSKGLGLWFLIMTEDLCIHGNLFFN